MSEGARRRTKKTRKRTRSFEEALARLEEIAAQLENSDLPLEKAMSLAEEGLELSELCEKELTAAEGKIQRLVERMGEAELKPLTAQTEAAEEDEEQETEARGE
jgi:exodeoxyribonuclease VII small subunit